jgi:thiol-disulfide isomerase/thioredoxin
VSHAAPARPPMGALPALATAALLALAAACSSAAPPAAAAPPSPPASSAVPAAPGPPPDPVGQGLCAALCSLLPSYAGLNTPRPRLSFETTAGVKVDDAHLRGKVVVLYIWNQPVPDVMEDLPELAKLARSLGDAPDVAVFSASIDEAPGRARQAFKELLDNEAPYAFVVGSDAQSIASMLGPDRLPATWLIDQRGVIRARFDGRAPLSTAPMRALLAGLRGNQGCSLEIEAGRVDSGSCAAQK